MIRFDYLNHSKMKTYSTIFKVILTGFIVLFLFGCNKLPKDEPSTPVKTLAISSLTSTSFISGGNFGYGVGSAVIGRGVCWSTNQNPTILDKKTSDMADEQGSFISNVTNLTPGVTYYVRAYGILSNGILYGNQITTTTPQH